MRPSGGNRARNAKNSPPRRKPPAAGDPPDIPKMNTRLLKLPEDDVTTRSNRRRLLVLDSAFTFEMITERELFDSVTCRDLGGFFEHVWTVHPFASMLNSDGWGPRFGQPSVYEVNDRHTFIEGKVGRFSGLKWLFPANFLLSQLGLVWMLWRLIKRERIDVIRTGSPLYLGLLGLILSRLGKVPLVIRVGANHDQLFRTTGEPMEPRLMRSRRIEKIVERFVFPRADLVAGANQDNLDFAIANGARPARSTLFRYGNLIDKRHFVDPKHREMDRQLFDELGVEPGMYIIYVGRLRRLKHPDHVVQVLAELRRRGHQVDGLLVGDGEMRGELHDLAAVLGVGEHLKMPGNMSQAWLAHFLPHAAAVISPHTGRALSEAALAAAPVIAYDVDWQGELIDNGLTGYLVQHQDWRAMTNAVERVLQDTALGRRLGNQLRSKALQMLDPVALDAHERAEYSKLIARRSPFGRTASQSNRARQVH